MRITFLSFAKISISSREKTYKVVLLRNVSDKISHYLSKITSVKHNLIKDYYYHYTWKTKKVGLKNLKVWHRMQANLKIIPKWCQRMSKKYLSRFVDIDTMLCYGESKGICFLFHCIGINIVAFVHINVRGIY